MDLLTVHGPTPLHGEVTVPGAKNSISKLLVASMLSDEESHFCNVPSIGDTQITIDICAGAGMNLERGDRGLSVQTASLADASISPQLAERNRLSVMLLAPLLNRCGEAIVPFAGGDRIGARPIDFHLDGYARLGATIEIHNGHYRATASRLRGATIALPYPSVTATENLLMAATLAEGTTVLSNAAIEPEVTDLVLFLQKMGARIDLGPDRTYVIEGVATLHGATHDVMPDRLVAASYGAAAVATGGDLFVRGARQRDLISFLSALQRAGGRFAVDTEGVRFSGGELRAVSIETSVHPGFMTDWHPPFATLLTQAHGTSVIHETVFEDRFAYADQLSKMGADIEIFDLCMGDSTCRFREGGHRHSAVIRGRAPLAGCDVHVPDLRAGFTYLMAAVIAKGESRITGIEELDRGYESVDEAFKGAGAMIERTTLPTETVGAGAAAVVGA